VALLVALAVGYAVRGSGDGSQPSIRRVALSALPPQAAQTVHLIEQGGPFPYPHNDGVVFHNLEHRLPAESDGYYREYTVPTPGAADRGARRMITGA
jgi:guanyl-specific ribonuclease Sa